VAIVGAGPAGTLTAHDLAKGGIAVALFDPTHPREKPCGGGLTARALELLPATPPGDPAPLRRVETCRFESGAGERVTVNLPRPMAVASRSALDAWLLRRARAAGAQHLSERVIDVNPDGWLTTGEGRQQRFDVIVGADGAGSLVRRTFLSPTPKDRLTMTAGWFAPGNSELVVRFIPEYEGYLWLFPRHGHVGVGVGAPLGRVPTRSLIERLDAEVTASFPDMAPGAHPRYAHTIPAPSSDPRSITEVAGPRWALVGDAASFADPITGEGIHFALRSGQLLARTLLAGETTMAYAERALEDFGRELVKAAAIRDRFYKPGFVRRVIRYGARSASIREILADLVQGDQGYVGLKRRLLGIAPRFLWESVTSFA
jgi:flavin-dependent dehydrogenase